MSNYECEAYFDAAELLICRVCVALHGPVWELTSGARGPKRQQFCDCSASHPGLEAWPGYDLPEAVALCRCCGRAALAGGSRWAPWFCIACLPPIEAINEACGAYRLPTARNSLLREITENRSLSPHAAAKQARRWGDWFERAERLEAYGRNVIRRNLGAFVGHLSAADVPLSDYLRFAARSAQAVEEAVFALGRRFRVPERVLRRVIPRC